MTQIGWTDETWNPVVGCSRVSAGCENCYAERTAHRLARFGKLQARYAGVTEMSLSKGPRWTGVLREVPEVLTKPWGWKRPRRCFVNSMSDLFHPEVSAMWISRIWNVMAGAPAHSFQVLTKRPERMLECVKELISFWAAEIFGGTNPLPQAMEGDRWPLPNVWLGISAEDQATYDVRIAYLMQTPAAVRFISAEPLLGPIDLNLDGPLAQRDPEGRKLDWVIVGGESGPGSRVCQVEWIREIVDQCRDARVACFVKQLGARPMWAVGDEMTGYEGILQPLKTSAAKGDDMADWPWDLRIQDYPDNGGAAP